MILRKDWELKVSIFRQEKKMKNGYVLLFCVYSLLDIMITLAPTIYIATHMQSRRKVLVQWNIFKETECVRILRSLKNLDNILLSCLYQVTFCNQGWPEMIKLELVCLHHKQSWNLDCIRSKILFFPHVFRWIQNSIGPKPLHI